MTRPKQELAQELKRYAPFWSKRIETESIESLFEGDGVLDIGHTHSCIVGEFHNGIELYANRINYGDCGDCAFHCHMLYRSVDEHDEKMFCNALEQFLEHAPKCPLKEGA